MYVSFNLIAGFLFCYYRINRFKIESNNIITSTQRKEKLENFIRWLCVCACSLRFDGKYFLFCLVYMYLTQYNYGCVWKSWHTHICFAWRHETINTTKASFFIGRQKMLVHIQYSFSAASIKCLLIIFIMVLLEIFTFSQQIIIRDIHISSRWCF